MIVHMKNDIHKASDFRQSPFWADYMQQIGWNVEEVFGINLYIKKLPLTISFIKIQHPLGKIPFEKIDSIAKKQHALCVVIEPHIAGYDEKQFLQSDYMRTKTHHAPTATRKIAIDTSVSNIVSSFSENAKRNIKKAEKNNVTTKIVFAKNDTHNKYFEKFYNLQKNLTDMKNFYAPGYVESKKKNSALKKGSFFIFAYEKNNNEPIAAVWYGYHKNVVTYLQTGITQKGYDLLANYILVVEGIKTGKKLGCSVFDFESIYDKRYPKEIKRSKGYSEFKSRFHGEEIYFPPSWIKIYNPYFQALYKLLAPVMP